jgi:hypothetical protein
LPPKRKDAVEQNIFLSEGKGRPWPHQKNIWRRPIHGWLR